MAPSDMDDKPVLVLLAADQRQPTDADDPHCVVCDRYGAYICDVTDEDVCSVECRNVCVLRYGEALVLREEQAKQRALAATLLRQRLDIHVVSGDDITTASNVQQQQQIPFPIVSFVDCDLPRQLLANMQMKLLETPSPVQMQVIPCVLARNNLLVVAPTGTGKTAAYLIPILAQLIDSQGFERNTSDVAIILAPIRELAIQIQGVTKLLAQGIPSMKTALLIGGFPVPPQLHRLQSGVQVIVSTPGRFIDIFTNYEHSETSLACVTCCVIDEVDMMLAIGFHVQISQIVDLLPPLTQMQMLFFSATISTQVEALVKQLLGGKGLKVGGDGDQRVANYFRIEVGVGKASNTTGNGAAATYTVNPNIRQKIVWAEDKAKKKIMFDFLKSKRNETTLVFVKSKIGANLLAEAVAKQTQIPSASIHADKSQKDRLLALETFVNQEVRVLVSTNVLSRGMDLLQVQNIVVFDFPTQVSDYIHLIGRTGRGNEGSGNALVMVNKDDKAVFKELIQALRGAKVSAVPKEIYQILHHDAKKEAFKSGVLVIDEAKRAFRVQDEIGGELGQPQQNWHQWSDQAQKKMRHS